MRTLLKWTGISLAAAGAAVVGYRAIVALRGRLDEGLSRAEQVTREAREAMERSEEALRHTQRAIRGVRGAVS